jgi:asparagine synthase (glutamine-hydrolysing)
MCGLAGAVALRSSAVMIGRDDLAAMVGAVSHRGPDESGMYLDERAALGHARLSIVDPEAGQQPMSDDRGTRWVVFNGEIFNHVELRAELEGLGHRFRTRSDTEVVVRAFDEWADEAFARFNGQFAIAIWDVASRRLTLARDRYGIVPLYLCEHDGRLLFASEVRAIFAADPGVTRAFDPVGLSETFTFWASVAPQTVFAGVTELEPGHVRTFSEAGVTDISIPGPGRSGGIPPMSFEDAASLVRARLEEAVRLRVVRSDVPVGCYLSGGLDSSLIAALARRATRGVFRTFSIRFEDPRYDESQWQRLMVERLDADHTEVLVSRADIADAFPSAVHHAERPVLRSAPAPMFLLSRAVRDAGIKVVLTGEGADEMFGGYDLFREAAVRRAWGRHPTSAMRPRLLERLYPYLDRSPASQRAMAMEYLGRDRQRWQEPGFGHQVRWRSTSAVQRLFGRAVREGAASVNVRERLLATLPATFGEWPALAQDQYLEVRTLLSGYLLSSQGDRMLMAHGVEGRFPFLDPGVVEVADALPGSFKLRGLDEKRILKHAAMGVVPDDIVRRTKRPYRAPDAVAFAGAERPAWVDHVLAPSSISDAGVFDTTAVARLWAKCRQEASSGRLSNADDMALLGVLSTGLLHESHIASKPERVEPQGLRTLIDRTAIAVVPATT